MCLGSNYTIVCCCFELLLFSVILCYALWHNNRYSAEGVTEFIGCNQTLGLFFIIVIHGVEAPRLTLHFSKASRRPFVAQPLTPAYPISAVKGPSSSLGQGDDHPSGIAGGNREALDKTKHTDNASDRIFTEAPRSSDLEKNPTCS